MSEEQDIPVEVKPTPAPTQAQKQSSGGSGALLAMVLAIAAAGGSYYVWQQQQAGAKERAALQQRVERLLALADEREAAQRARIEQLSAHRHEETEQRLASLEQSLPALSRRLAIQQRDWDLAEVDYLLRLAEHSLQLSRDIPTTVDALQRARGRLLEYGNGGSAGVVAAIDEGIAALTGLEQQNAAQIVPRLSEVIAGLDALPFALQAEQAVQGREPPTPPPAVAELSERMGYWGRLMWHDIKSLVTIRRSDEVTPPLMNGEKRFLLQEQLRLKLETARLAATGHNQPLFQASLDEGAALLSRYFDSNHEAVVGAYATLKELAALSVDPALPSLQAVRQQLHSERLQAVEAEGAVDPEAQAPGEGQEIPAQAEEVSPDSGTDPLPAEGGADGAALPPQTEMQAEPESITATGSEASTVEGEGAGGASPSQAEPLPEPEPLPQSGTETPPQQGWVGPGAASQQYVPPPSPWGNPSSPPADPMPGSAWGNEGWTSSPAPAPYPGGNPWGAVPPPGAGAYPAWGGSGGEPQ